MLKAKRANKRYYTFIGSMALILRVETDSNRRNQVCSLTHNLSDIYPYVAQGGLEPPTFCL